MNQSIEELITELSMTYSFKMHLIVEGNDDKKFFRSLLNGIDKVNLICVWGADNVMHVIREVDKLKLTMRICPTLGVVDRRLSHSAWHPVAITKLDCLRCQGS